MTADVSRNFSRVEETFSLPALATPREISLLTRSFWQLMKPSLTLSKLRTDASSTLALCIE
jgi:hypothetical protein